MNFVPTALRGAFLVNIEPFSDARGFFARSWCIREAEQVGLDPCVAQCSISFNKLKGTLRGMHFQAAPYEEAKLVRCTRGAMHDVLLDLRPDSATYGQWQAFELTDENRAAVYVPAGVAHGFQTLVDNTEVFYQISEFHLESAARGVRWNDPAFCIEWPLAEPILSAKDAGYPDFQR